jgi:hypothetical protein
MTASTSSDNSVIAELLDIAPSLVPLCTAIGRLSRTWDEKDGSIVAFVREHARELSHRDKQLVIKLLIGLQAPIVGTTSLNQGDRNAQREIT